MCIRDSAYSLRCIPQVHGAVRDTLAHCRQVFETEANSAVDNPLVFITDARNFKGDVISGGNFHGEPLAFALDFLGIALSALAGISERRIERLVNPALSEGLPPFLAQGAGLNSGFMLAQVTAAAPRPSKTSAARDDSPRGNALSCWWTPELSSSWEFMRPMACMKSGVEHLSLIHI